MKRTKQIPLQALEKSTWLRWPLLAVFALTLAACGKEPAEPKLLAHTAHEVIVPLYAALDAEAVKQLELSQAFCQATEPDQQQSLQQQLQKQWRATMSAWAGVQPIGFGPLEDGNLRWKLQFWPDRKDLTRKKIEALIASDDELTAARVASASVSVQGLAALEYLLFDTSGGALEGYQNGEQASRRCLLLQAIAERVQQVTHRLLNEWYGDINKLGYADTYSQPGADNALYPNNNASIAALLDTLVVGSEVVKRNKLGIPVGKDIAHAKPYRLEAWRSQHSLALMRASVATLEQLYRGNGGYGLQHYLVEETDVDVALLRDIDESFKATNAQLLQLNAPLFSQLKQPEQHSKLVELHRRLNVLQGNLNKLPESLGIRLGFNSNDGD